MAEKMRKGRVGNLIEKEHVPVQMDRWVGGWKGGGKSPFKDCSQQSINKLQNHTKYLKAVNPRER